MSDTKHADFVERVASSKYGIFDAETTILLCGVMLLSLKWVDLVLRADRLLRRSMVAWLRQLASPAANKVISTVPATKQQAGSTKRQSRSSKRHSQSAKQQTLLAKPVEAPSPPSESLQLIIDVLGKVKIEEDKLSLTQYLLRTWLSQAIKYPSECLCVGPPIFGYLYTLGPYTMEMKADHLALYFAGSGISENTPMFVKLIFMNVVVFVAAMAIFEAGACLLFGYQLMALWSWYGVLRVAAAFRRLSAVHFVEEYMRTRSELASLQQEHVKCVNELETLRQDKVQRRCKMCYDVDATSIVMDCRHIDLCADCVGKLGESNRALWAEGQCPEYEKPCPLSGKEAHVHCLICRGGGARHKVFFT